jgi:small-conductance mechanosensitive channel
LCGQDWLLGDGLRIVLTILLAVVARWLLHRAIDKAVTTMTARADSRDAAAGRTGRVARAGRVLADASGLSSERHAQRMRTMGSLLRSIVTFVVGSIAVLTVLALVHIPLGPLLASAGVGGVALGFGAQSLVKDFLSGLFMIFEDQYGVGDVIDTGEAVGTVEEVSLRVTRLRDARGVTWYIRNGEIVRIGNKSQGWATAIVDLPISYAENTDRAIGIMREAAAALGEDPAWADRLLGTPAVMGVESIVGATVTIRTTARCLPGEQYALQRELRERLKDALDSAGFKAPPPLPFEGGPR